jgi:adenylate cyclase
MKVANTDTQNRSDKVSLFSIGFKLVTIITIIVLAALGVFTFIVDNLVRDYLRNTAEKTNLERCRQVAREAESTFGHIRSNSIGFMQTINAVGIGGDFTEQAAGGFFEQNREIAALFFTVPGRPAFVLVNNRFFLSQEVDEAMAESWFKGNKAKEAIERALLGETVLLNVSPYFATHLSAMLFPWEGGAGGILFSPESLNDSFGYGANQSYLINGEGDILIHPDSEHVLGGAKIAKRDFIKSIRESLLSDKQENDYIDERGIVYLRAFAELLELKTDAFVITSIEHKLVFEGVKRTIERIFISSLVVLFLSIIGIWFFSKSISVPLKALAKAARAIEGGTFEVKLRPKGRDEVGLLTASFNQMSSALSDFGKFTNKDIALQAMRGQIKPGGLPKEATIFFSDIRGITKKSETFTKTFGDEASNRIVSWLNEHFTQMIECVQKTGGVVDKFIGDAVMAHWGTASTSGSPRQDAFNCVVTALMMRKALYYANKERQQDDPGNPPIQIGCGINTGIVTAGQIGSDLRMEYTVIGDPVNLASRIEALNKPLGTDILISESTWLLVRDKIITEEMPSVTVKGKTKPLRIFAVVNLTKMDKGPRTLAEVRTLLGIKPPDISKVDVDAHEEKYKIGGSE